MHTCIHYASPVLRYIDHRHPHIRVDNMKYYTSIRKIRGPENTTELYIHNVKWQSYTGCIKFVFCMQYVLRAYDTEVEVSGCLCEYVREIQYCLHVLSLNICACTSMYCTVYTPVSMSLRVCYSFL